MTHEQNLLTSSPDAPEGQDSEGTTAATPKKRASKKPKSAPVAKIKKIAIATSEQYAALTPQDQVFPTALGDQGVDSQIVIWNQITPAELKEQGFTTVWLRSVWDCWEHTQEFMTWLRQIAEQDLTLVNPFDIIQWNSNKEYLRQLQKKGVAMIPTQYIEASLDVITPFLDEIAPTQKYPDGFVLKPTVSASGNDTYKITSKKDWKKKLPEIKESLAKKSDCLWMVQAFLKNLAQDGEVSVFFLNDPNAEVPTPKRFHAVLKKAAPGEFLVQPERGGSFTRIDKESAYTGALQAATRVAKALPEGWTYARIDLVPAYGSASATWWLSEAEMIEPNLFTGVSDPAFVQEIAKTVAAL